MGETIWYLIALLLGAGIIALAAYEAGVWAEREKWQRRRQASAWNAARDAASRSRHPSGRDQ